VSADESGGRLALWDWRRRVASLYAEARAAADPAAAWRHWRETRDALFRDHPQSPLEPAQRARFRRLSYGDYDARLRFAVALHPMAAGSVARFMPARTACSRSGASRAPRAWARASAAS
jgi:hypothetical protein